MSQPYLFYSERCPNSKQVIETIKGLNKAGLYKFILVESLARDKIPAFLKKVPTLYVPDSKEVIIGKDIYGYIAKPTNSRKEVPSKSDAGVSAPNQFGELSAWGFEGQGMIGESYSLWDTPGQFVNQEGTSRYTFLDGSSGAPSPGGLPSSNAPTSKNTLDDKSKSTTNADIMSRMEKMTKQREAEFAGVARK
jgi:glutaredoxin-related protein